MLGVRESKAEHTDIVVTVETVQLKRLVRVTFTVLDPRVSFQQRHHVEIQRQVFHPAAGNLKLLSAVRTRLLLPGAHVSAEGLEAFQTERVQARQTLGLLERLETY